MKLIDMNVRREPKYKQIADSLREEIHRDGSVRGQKLPSDAKLSIRYGTSRLTIIKSLRQLESEGLIRRRAGSGSYVNNWPEPEQHIFGLLIPDLGEGEIFEPICQGMARAGQSSHQALLWGNTSAAAETKQKRTLELCRYFIAKKVSGVFFAPLELDESRVEVNSSVLAQLKRANMPVVFLDRGIAPFPHSNEHDVVGIDNWREGCRMAEYLIELGAQRLGFVVKPASAPTVDARIAGLNHALWKRCITFSPDGILCGDPTDAKAVMGWYERFRPDGVLCANDFTAAQFMQTLLSLGIGVPEEVRIVGFDDVKYASLLPVPLTTLRQPCHEIGFAAIDAMLDRLAKPSMVPRTISLACNIVVRKSCGGNIAT